METINNKNFIKTLLLTVLFALPIMVSANWWEYWEDFCKDHDIPYNEYDDYDDFIRNGSDNDIDNFYDGMDNFIDYGYDDDGNIEGYINEITVTGSNPNSNTDNWDPEPDPEPDCYDPCQCWGIDCNDDYNDYGLGSTDNDNNNNNNKPKPKDDVPLDTLCPPDTQNHNERVNEILDSNYGEPGKGNDSRNVQGFMNQLRDKACDEPYEYGGSIYCNEKYDAYDMLDQSYDGSRIYTKTDSLDNYVRLKTTKSIIFTAHTHIEGKSRVPSAVDAIYLCYAYHRGAKGIYGGVNFACDGSEYMVYVDNRSNFENFCNNSNNAGFFVKSELAGGFGGVWGGDYTAVFRNLKDQNYSDDMAKLHALSYVLEKYNTGIKVAGRDNKDSPFKNYNTKEGKDNKTYNPTKCP